FQAEDGIRDRNVTGVQTCALPISITIPWGVLAYKIWHGNKPIDEDLKEEIWIRSTFASLVFVVAGVVVAVLDYMTIKFLGLPTRSEERRVGKECGCRRSRSRAAQK